MKDVQKNVLGEQLEECSKDPITGWFRDGCCNTDENDHGLHTVCVKVNNEFLEWCKQAGNDLITPHPEFGFPGLKDGDNWCVCAGWVAKAIDAGWQKAGHLEVSWTGEGHDAKTRLLAIQTVLGQVPQASAQINLDVQCEFSTEDQLETKFRGSSEIYSSLVSGFDASVDKAESSMVTVTLALTFTNGTEVTGASAEDLKDSFSLVSLGHCKVVANRLSGDQS